MATTTYARNKIVDDFTSVAPYVWPALWLSLHTADPGLAGSHAAEIGGGIGYARLSLAGLMGASAGGISVSTSLISIGPATANWGTIIFLGIEDSGVIGAGNMAIPGVPSIPRTINSGQTFQIPAGQLQIAMR